MWFYLNGFINSQTNVSGRLESQTPTLKCRCILLKWLYGAQANERDWIFQQDGAKAHMVKDTVTFLQEFFSDRVITNPFWPLGAQTLLLLNFSGGVT